MMYSIKILAVTMMLMLVSCCISKSQNTEAVQIDSLMNQVHRAGIFNGNILVIKKGKTVFQSSYGYANSSKTTKLNAGYIFNIGSIGKEFNAVGIMMLREQGKLSLDDKVSKYITDLPEWADHISIKNLLQYTSGLPDINWKTIKSDADIMNDMKQIKELNFEPGSNYAYNNSNVFFQRRIIEKISGTSFQRFVETYMLKPCGMTESAVDPDLKGSNVAVSFNNDYVESPRQFAYVMTGWTSVTAIDLYKWTKRLHDYKLLNPASFKEILLPVAPNKQSGLGGGRIERDKVVEHTHHGSSADFEALMYTEPSDDNAIILLTNNRNLKVFEIKDAVKAILEGKAYEIPKPSLLSAFKGKLNELKSDEMIAFYDDLKKNHSEDYNFKNESELNTVGYQLMGAKRYDDAVKIFELNVQLFPKSGNVYDSLAEAFLSKGDNKTALANYKKSLELNPDNPGAKEIVTQLEKEK